LLVFLQGRTLLAGVAVTLGALIKPVALLALPVFWRPWSWRLPLAVAATLAVAYLPYLSVGSGVLGFLRVTSRRKDLPRVAAASSLCGCCSS
jgi:hypothetical protein